MMHHLKISTEYYDAGANCYKSFEVRKDDRGYRVGDTVVMHENVTDHQRESIIAEIKYILHYEDFPDGLKEGYCVLGLSNVHFAYCISEACE